MFGPLIFRDVSERPGQHRRYEAKSPVSLHVLAPSHLRVNGQGSAPATRSPRRPKGDPELLTPRRSFLYHCKLLVIPVFSLLIYPHVNVIKAVGPPSRKRPLFAGTSCFLKVRLTQFTLVETLCEYLVLRTERNPKRIFPAIKTG